MGDINKFFSRSEIACECGCGFDTIDWELLEVCTDVRLYFKQKMHFTSVCRCQPHNRYVARKFGDMRLWVKIDASTHVQAKAADTWVAHVHADDVAGYLASRYPDKYGIGRYVGRTHIDVRKTKTRWDNR